MTISKQAYEFSLQAFLYGYEVGKTGKSRETAIKEFNQVVKVKK